MSPGDRAALPGARPAALRRRASSAARPAAARPPRSTPRSTASTRGPRVATIEDPVEYQVPGVTQIEVTPKHRPRLSPAACAHPPLGPGRDPRRRDPRRGDGRIAVQAAMTGHLVLTTLHTQRRGERDHPPGGPGRRPGRPAARINCIVSQRLARRLCTTAASRTTRRRTTERGGPSSGTSCFQCSYRATGCLQCSNTGYTGRVASPRSCPCRAESGGSSSTA